MICGGGWPAGRAWAASKAAEQGPRGPRSVRAYPAGYTGAGTRRSGRAVRHGPPSSSAARSWSPARCRQPRPGLPGTTGSRPCCRSPGTATPPRPARPVPGRRRHRPDQHGPAASATWPNSSGPRTAGPPPGSRRARPGRRPGRRGSAARCRAHQGPWRCWVRRRRPEELHAGGEEVHRRAGSRLSTSRRCPAGTWPRHGRRYCPARVKKASASVAERSGPLEPGAVARHPAHEEQHLGQDDLIADARACGQALLGQGGRPLASPVNIAT